jgi:hypothetical protein
MFNFFKKKRSKRISEWEYDLLTAVIEELPKKYLFLNGQTSSEFLLDSVDNEFLNNNWKRTICNQTLYNKYRNDEYNFKLIGAKVFDKNTQNDKNIELDIYEGILIGYRIEENANYDLERISTDDIREIYYKNDDVENLKAIIGNNIDESILKLLDIENTFKIELSEGVFYVIKDLGDGNYLSMDNDGAVYGMFHDPYEVDKVFHNKESFYNALISKKFKISEYFDRKMS